MKELSESEKLANKLTIEKAFLMGILDAVIQDLPRPYRRAYWANKIAGCRLITPIGWCDELPYTTKPNQP